MVTLHRVEVKVGDKVWDFQNGWDEVIGLDSGLVYKIETNSNCYTSDGQYCSDDLFPSLFWDEFEVPTRAFHKPEHLKD